MSSAALTANSNISSLNTTSDETTPGSEGVLRLRDATHHGRHNEREGIVVILAVLARDQGRIRNTRRIVLQPPWLED
jgi:hypothetical protein